MVAVLFQKEKKVRVMWVAEWYLLEWAGKVGLTADYLKKRGRYGHNIGEFTAWSHIKIGNVFYYSYEGITEKYRLELPDKAVLEEMARRRVDVEKGRVSDTDAIKAEVQAWIRDIRGEQYNSFWRYYVDIKQVEQRRKLSYAAELVWEMKCRIRDGVLDPKRSDFWIGAGEAIKAEGMDYLPSCWRRLKDKVLASMEVMDVEGVIEVVTLPRQGNDNGRKYDEDAEVLKWAMYLRGRPENYTNTQITRQIGIMCAMLGKLMPSDSYFAQFFAQEHTKQVTSEGRYGKRGRLGTERRGMIPIVTALHAGDCWQMDASRFNIVECAVELNDKSLSKCLFMTVVRDVHSGKVLGWHFDVAEHGLGYKWAFQMAVRATGHLPYELVTDRFPGHNKKDGEWVTLMERCNKLGMKWTITSSATAKARLERWFLTMQDVFLQQSQFYYGHGVKSKRNYAHRSEEYMTKLRKEANKDGFNYDDAVEEGLKVIEAYNGTKLSAYSRKYKQMEYSPNDLFEMSAKQNVKCLDWCEMIQVIGTNKTRATIRQQMIKIEVRYAAFYYPVPPEIFMQHKEVYVWYDEEDMSRVVITDRTEMENPLAELMEQKAIQVYGPERDVSALGKAKQRIKDNAEQLKQEYQDVVEDVSEFELLLSQTGSLDKASAERVESGYLQLPDFDYAQSPSSTSLTQRSSAKKTQSSTSLTHRLATDTQQPSSLTQRLAAKLPSDDDDDDGAIEVDWRRLY